MINRTLIRTKVLQIIYAYHQKGDQDLKVSENELNISLQKAYNLYYYLLLLIVEFTDIERKRLDKLKYKHFLTEEEKHPNKRFADNHLAEQLKINPAIIHFTNKYGWFWNDEFECVKSLFEEIKQSDAYAKYIASDNAFNDDYNFWEAVFEHIVSKSSMFSEWLEDKNVYWNDDLGIIVVFVLKTLKQFQYEDISKHLLFPMFKNEADKQYTFQLLHFSILEAEKNSGLISSQIQNWDMERIVLLDRIIMQMALSEISNFPTIPLQVTLNEYIELARYYSTPKSPSFINGILQSVISGKVFKNFKV